MMGMPRCREVTRAVAGEELAEYGPLRRLWLRAHLLFCPHCGRYARQMRTIGRAAREVLGAPLGDRETLERLRRAILGRLTPPGGG